MSEEEAPDEWTALAESYTAALVPSFEPIYKAVADRLQQGLLQQGGDAPTPPPPRRVLDFGCGPGEPSFTLWQRFSQVNVKVVGVDSTKPMLANAERRCKQARTDGQVEFHHVRRDISTQELKKTVATNENFECVVSTFVLHYVDFARRVELVNVFLEMAPKVLLLTWGEQSKVGFLRALKTFGTWKRDITKDICDIQLSEEEHGATDESPKGSFTMPRQGNFQSVVDQAEKAELSSFEIHTIPIKFPSVKALLSFLPMPMEDSDCQAIWKLLKHWNSDQVTLGDSPDEGLCFPTDVVFCEISRQE